MWAGLGAFVVGYRNPSRPLTKTEIMKQKKLTKTELRNWMNIYHDKWIELHNKYIVKPSNSQN